MMTLIAQNGRIQPFVENVLQEPIKESIIDVLFKIQNVKISIINKDFVLNVLMILFQFNRNV